MAQSAHEKTRPPLGSERVIDAGRLAKVTTRLQTRDFNERIHVHNPVFPFRDSCHPNYRPVIHGWQTTREPTLFPPAVPANHLEPALTGLAGHLETAYSSCSSRKTCRSPPIRGAKGFKTMGI